MTLRKAYREMMDNIEMNEEMRCRILQNISKGNGGAIPQKRTFFPQKALFAAAACFALLVGVFTVARHPAQQVEQAGPVFDAVECGSVQELSERLGFEVKELKNLPVSVKDVTYCAFWGELAQIEYAGEDGMITYRVCQGAEDPSGDYEVYAETVTEEIGGTQVTLKGSGEQYNLALWQKGGLSCSIRAEPGLMRQQIMEMIPG